MAKKARPTPKRATALARMRERGEALRAWLEERAQAPRPHVETRVAGSGVTRLMRNLPGPTEVAVHEHDFTAGWDRRHFRTNTGKVIHRHEVDRPLRRVAGEDRPQYGRGRVLKGSKTERVRDRSREDGRPPALNEPYRKPLEALRDNPKASRRLRTELRHG